ncbi:hypothetical protein ACFMPD_03565 [Sedimentitalea sp. HM32M-2]|uniref:hypothetical protein n=1 Tax=Sedimentitalea sp. HM32M-2 TaxID=3351566 RepID=UPI00362900AD
MEFEAQETFKLVILMIAGAAFAGVGLWLLLRPKPSGASAKIELFGLKFESSSAGLLVFLIGAVFLVLPLFVPEKTVIATTATSTTANAATERATATTTEPAPAAATAAPRPADPGTASPPAPAGRSALLLPPDAHVSEQEPNDRIQAANQLGFGQTLKGRVRAGEADWVVIALPDPAPKFVELKVRHVGGNYVEAVLFDAREIKIGRRQASDGTHYIRAEVLKNDRYYVRLVCDIGSSVDYEIALQHAAAD